eukprot:2565281-Pleurochrysis_carterae.AAC.1
MADRFGRSMGLRSRVAPGCRVTWHRAVCRIHQHSFPPNNKYPYSRGAVASLASNYAWAWPGQPLLAASSAP